MQSTTAWHLVLVVILTGHHFPIRHLMLAVVHAWHLLAARHLMLSLFHG